MLAFFFLWVRWLATAPAQKSQGSWGAYLLPKLHPRDEVMGSAWLGATTGRLDLRERRRDCRINFAQVLEAHFLSSQHLNMQVSEVSSVALPGTESCDAKPLENSKPTQEEPSANLGIESLAQDKQNQT